MDEQDHIPVMISVAEIGDWLHSDTTVREVCKREDFWDYAELGRDELTARITAAGGIDAEHALEGTTIWTGELVLTDGCHRWAVAEALGLESVPVAMLAVGESSPVTGWIPDVA